MTTKQILGADGQTYTVTDPSAPSALTSAANFIAARSGEQSTLLGAIGGAALTPTLVDNVTNAVAAGLSGNIIGAAAYGVPALIGIVGSLAAIFTPEKPKELSDDQIKSVVSGLTREQLIGMLEQSNAVSDSLAIRATYQPKSTGQVQTNSGVVLNQST